jgi:PAS domain S-box-containing protein
MEQWGKAAKSKAWRVEESFVLAAIYFGCGAFGLSMALVNKSASAVWPPSGLALAALLLGGSRLWPGVFGGAFLVNILTQGSVVTSLAIATGNTLEAVVGARLVIRFANGALAFDRTKNIFKFVLFGAMLSTLISPTIGVVTLCFGQLAFWREFWTIWLTWWLGDMVSNVMIAPLIILWATKPFPRFNSRSAFQAAILFIVLVWVGRLVFLGKAPRSGDSYPLEYLTIPPLLWAAFRFQERGAVTASVLLSGIAIWGTRHQLGPFVRTDANESMLLLQTFTGTITMTGLVIASIVSERVRGEQRLVVQDAISRVLAEAGSLKEATPKIFQALCEKAQWDVGSIWDVNHAANELTCVEFWHVSTQSFPQFEALTREIKFKPGIGLPGRVWSTRKPLWIRDVVEDNNFPRATVAAADNLHGALCFPLKLGDEVVSIIECFSREFREPDEDFLQMLDAIGSQIGQFIERKRAEEAQAKLAAIVESSGDAIISQALTGVISSWNKGAERIFGYTAAEAIGQPIWLLVPSDHQKMERELLERVRTGEHIDHYHTQRVRKDASILDVSLSISPIRDGSGQVIGASKIARDISEQKKIERALAQAEASLRQHAEDLERRVQERTAKLQETIQSLDGFCYSIAHDLRAPLRAVGGFSNELFKDYDHLLDEPGKDYLRRIRSAAARMDQLILDLLRFGRLNTAELPAQIVKLEDVVHTALTPLEEEIKSKHAQINVKAPLLAVRANSVMVEQAVGNLIANALKFVPRNIEPRVDIWTERRDGMVRLSIQDNGIGIKPDHVKKLFQPFVRLVNGADYPGTGIGLAIVRKGVERMGGQVGLTSKLKEGSCFWIELPNA